MLKRIQRFTDASLTMGQLLFSPLSQMFPAHLPLCLNGCFTNTQADQYFLLLETVCGYME